MHIMPRIGSCSEIEMPVNTSKKKSIRYMKTLGQQVPNTRKDWTSVVETIADKHRKRLENCGALSAKYRKRLENCGGTYCRQTVGKDK